MLTSDQLHSFFEIFQHSSLIRNPFQQLLNQTRDTTMMLQDLRAQLAPITASLNKSLWFSDDETNHSDHGTQTDGELSPLIIKPKKYNKKKSCSPLKLNLNVRILLIMLVGGGYPFIPQLMVKWTWELLFMTSFDHSKQLKLEL